MYTPIELDKIRNLRYGMKAISQFEKILGKNLAKIDMENLTMEEQAVIIWAGLVHEDSSLTPDRVMELIDEHSDIQTALETMGKAFEAAFGKKEKNAQRVASSESK
jgi:hypothetical protein